MVLGANYPKRISPCAKQLSKPFEQKTITVSLRERYSSHFLLSGFLSLPLADDNPIKLDWEDKVINVNQGSQKGLEIGDINPGIPNFFELKNITSAEIKLTSFTSYPLLDHNFIFESSSEFKNHLAVQYGKAFGFSSEKYSDDDTHYNEKVFRAFKASYENIKKEERLNEILHNNETELFAHLESKKGKFDLIFALFSNKILKLILFFFLIVPFIPKQPNEILKSGDMYLRSIDKSHRRYYDKFVANDNSERDNDNAKNIQQLYVKKK
jgi:hypothetical protein